MTDTELAEIESALDIRLPDNYRDVMLNYPFPPESWPDQAEMPNNAKFLIWNNDEIRADGLYGPKWQHQHFAFGHTSGGDAFALDTSLKSSPVIRVDRETSEFRNDATTLADWVSLRINWYVDFDPAVEGQKYESLIAAIENAGFYVAPVHPMGGWDRVCPASKKRSAGGYSGNSFWVSQLPSGWYLGTWGGWIYRIPDQTRIADCCVDWLRRSSDGTRADFDENTKKEFSLSCVSDDEFDTEIKAI